MKTCIAAAICLIMFAVVESCSHTPSNPQPVATNPASQPASKPADERWIGPNPIAHGAGAKRGLIC